MQHLLTGSYNRDAVRLLRGTNVIFKCNSLFFSFLKCYAYQSTEILEKTPSRSGHVIQEKRGWHPNWQKTNWARNSLPRTGSLSSNPWTRELSEIQSQTASAEEADSYKWRCSVNSPSVIIVHSYWHTALFHTWSCSETTVINLSENYVICMTQDTNSRHHFFCSFIVHRKPSCNNIAPVQSCFSELRDGIKGVVHSLGLPWSTYCYDNGHSRRAFACNHHQCQAPQARGRK